ncbi:MAG: hypothetical protein ABSD78_09020 [Acidimicrobiales bacterium]|jgi:hypothetical protein
MAVGPRRDDRVDPLDYERGLAVKAVLVLAVVVLIVVLRQLNVV